MLSRYDKPRVLLYSLLLSSILFSYITACSNTGDTVTAEQAAGATTVTLKATLFSSVPEGKGTTPCSFSFEFNGTAGANDTLIAQETISDLQFKCDASGVPESGQGIETTFTVDPKDPMVLEGIMIEVFFAKSGASVIDDVLLNFYSDSSGFNVQECIRGDTCTVIFEASNINEAISSSGILEFVGGLSCPAAAFIDSLCTGGCLGDELLSIIGCEGGGGGGTAVCGNGKVDSGETCDTTCTGKCVACNVGTTCAPPKTKGECTCVPDTGGAACGNGTAELDEECGEPSLPKCNDGGFCVNCQCVVEGECGNGVPEVGEECETCPPGKICDPLPGCDVGILCVDCQCIIESLCKNGVVDEGEECETCPPEMDCGPLPTCDVGDSCVDCLCDTPSACQIAPNEVGLCEDDCDNDLDGFKNCADTEDCGGSPACVVPPPPTPCVCPVCGPGTVCDIDVCICVVEPPPPPPPPGPK